MLACAGAVSFLSIAGYIAVTGNNPGTQIEAADDSEANGNNSVDDPKDLPTLMQMAARDDALSIPEIVEKVSPSVVGISSIITSKNDFTGGAATGTSTGTGIIMTEDGYIITVITSYSIHYTKLYDIALRQDDFHSRFEHEEKADRKQDRNADRCRPSMFADVTDEKQQEQHDREIGPDDGR